MSDALRSMARRRWKIPKFGVGLLLTITACVASYLTGRRHGFEDARDIWGSLPKLARIYNVHDLISKQAAPVHRLSVEELSEQLQSEIWQMGVSKTPTDYRINAGPMAGSIVVVANDIGHSKTAEILDRLRTDRETD